MANIGIHILTLEPAHQEVVQVTIVPDGVTLLREIPSFNVILPRSNIAPYILAKHIRNSMASLPEKRKGELPEYDAQLRNAGHELHRVILHSLGEDWDTIIRQSTGRYKLSIDPSLWHLPWELLRHEKYGYLDTISKPIVRRIAGSVKDHTTHLRNPRIYFVGADPIDHATRSPEQYKKLIESIPNDIDYQSIVQRDIPQATGALPQWERIVRDLQARPPDILHIVTHGSISSNEAESGFIFEEQSRDKEIVIRHEELFNILIRIRSVKLLVIAACQSSLLFEHNPVLTEQLFRQTDLKAAVLMASDISAEAMIKFTEYFYGALWQRLDVAHAVAASRSFLRAPSSELISLQWSIPMIYESSPLDPFGKWIEEIRSYTNVPPLQSEYLDEALLEAKRIRSNVSRLIELQNQVRPSTLRIKLGIEQTKTSIRRFDDVMSLLGNHRYAPEDESILNSLRVIKSRTIPVINRFLDIRTKWDMSTEALEAIKALVDHIEHYIDLLRTRRLLLTET